MYRRFTSHEVQEFAHRLSERLEKARRERDTLTIADHESILKELEETTEALEIAGEELRVQSDELTSAAQAMEVEAARFQRLFELAPDPILTTDLMGTIVEANRAATRFLGVSREGLRRKPLAAFLASTSRGHFRAYLTRAARLEAVGEVELHVRTRGSENMTVDARAAYLPPSAYGQPELAWRLTPRRGAERGEGQAAECDGPAGATPARRRGRRAGRPARAGAPGGTGGALQEPHDGRDLARDPHAPPVHHGVRRAPAQRHPGAPSRERAAPGAVHRGGRPPPGRAGR